MAARKRNPTAQTLKARIGFRISKKPLVHVAADDERDNVGNSVGRSGEYGAPILFAIARDPRTIFTSWNIDWYGADGLAEKTVAVEPMAAMHYLTTSGAHSSYGVEMGYYQPADVWHSIAISPEIAMPPTGVSEATDVDLATIPFHVGFQQLLNLFRTATQTRLATVLSQFQKRALSGEERTRLSPEQKRILCKLDVSLSDIAAARRAFDEADSEKLARRTGALPGFSASSPSRGFADSSWS